MQTHELNAKLQERAKLIGDARAILDKAEAEKRSLTAEEKTNWDKLHSDAAEVYDFVQRAKRQEDAARSLEAAQEAPPIVGGKVEDRKVTEKTESFRRYILDGRNGVSPDEFRALQADSPTGGGYVVPPQEFVSALIQAVDNAVFVRQFATKYQVNNADSLGAASLDADPADPTWTAEIGTGTEDSTMAFGKRELKPNPLAKRIKVSRTLLRKAPMVEALVRNRFAYKIGTTQENAFLNGTGSNQPLGLFTASDFGISTGRDVSTGNSATTPTADGLKEAKYTLKTQYWPNAKWVFHRSVVKMIDKLKDGEGRYLWQPSLVIGQPDLLLSFPVQFSEYAPSTITSSAYVGLLGDLTYYWIADALNQEIQRLEELYAETNQVGFISRSETDGMPVLEEAFVRVKLG